MPSMAPAGYISARPGGRPVSLSVTAAVAGATPPLCQAHEDHDLRPGGPVRSLWQEQQARGRREGWYRTVTGKVESVRPAAGGGTVTRIETTDGILEPDASYVTDCTGLEADIAEHRLLADLLEHGGAGRNPIGRLDVERDFEVRGTANGDGKMYASGTATLGGYFPGVDTFLGLQIAAQGITDDLARQGFCRRIGPRRSISQWFKWARGRKI